MPRQRKHLIEAIKNNQPYEVELSMVSKDGRPLWILVTNSVIYAADGSLEKYIRIITNILPVNKPSMMWRYYRLLRASRQAAS
jgi:PAS domain-containing protein